MIISRHGCERPSVSRPFGEVPEVQSVSLGDGAGDVTCCADKCNCAGDSGGTHQLLLFSIDGI